MNNKNRYHNNNRQRLKSKRFRNPRHSISTIREKRRKTLKKSCRQRLRRVVSPEVPSYQDIRKCVISKARERLVHHPCLEKAALLHYSRYIYIYIYTQKNIIAFITLIQKSSAYLSVKSILKTKYKNIT